MPMVIKYTYVLYYKNDKIIRTNKLFDTQAEAVNAIPARYKNDPTEGWVEQGHKGNKQYSFRYLVSYDENVTHFIRRVPTKVDEDGNVV